MGASTNSLLENLLLKSKFCINLPDLFVLRNIRKESRNPCFQIHSPTIDAIRIDLGCSPLNEYYNMHMTVCEKLL